MRSCFHSRFVLIFGILFAFASHSAVASRRVSADEFTRTLISARSSNIPDADLAQRIAALELTERPSASTLKAWVANSTGPKTTDAINSLANLATFLNPPPADIPTNPAPDFPTQRAMIAQAIDFVAATLSNLPDFFADRVTTSYDDSPQSFEPGDWPVRLGVHPIGQATQDRL